jgi:hypothetical protein
LTGYLLQRHEHSVNSSWIKARLNSWKQIPLPVAGLFAFAIICSLYSLFIGMNNEENLWEKIPLSERYSRLPMGLYLQVTDKIGPFVLVLVVLINLWILRKNSTGEVTKIRKLIKWFFVLAFIYILLLPLGGYRNYRSYIIRMDTFLPVTLGLILIYGITTYCVARHTGLKWKMLYYAVIVAATGIFINADTGMRKYNDCERRALDKLAHAQDKIVLLDEDCSVLSWAKTTDYNDTKLKGELLFRWNITSENKMYYQK